MRDEVWDLSENSSGVSLSFKTNSTKMLVKWGLKLDFKMNHMAETGIKGVDLYVKFENGWQYLSSGLPLGTKNEQTLFENFPNITREYRLHLPLYDTVTDLQLGVNKTSEFEIIKSEKLPIVFYGTSITQGGCASRPGLAHTNIISRILDLECINLGFSGNGHMEVSVGSILSKINAKLIVIECMANVDLETVKKDTIPLIESIRKGRVGNAPSIIFLEEAIVNDNFPDKKIVGSIHNKNKELKNQIVEATKLGHENLYIIYQNGLIDRDTESTVDGVHYNDLGFERHAKHFVSQLGQLKII